MSKNIKPNFFHKLYLNTVSSIAFIPTLIAIGLFLLSLFTLYLDQGSPDSLVGYSMDIKNILDPDSARALLGAIAGGMISLMVFSFSMVMVVLSQISSNFSPRVLPSLVGLRFHQVVMGIYLGTIVYTFVVLSTTRSKIYAFEVPSLSIIMAAVLSLICLALFIAFVQSISQNIQIGNIIHRIYQDTCKTLTHEIEEETYIPAHQLPDTERWTPVGTPISGYFHSINKAVFIRRTAAMDITLRMYAPLGSFMHHGDVIFLASRSLSEEEQEKIFSTFVFRHEELISQNYLYGFKQLTEIAVKALSPGINDPGTAIQAMDWMTDLFVIRMKLSGFRILTDGQGKLRMIQQPVPIEEIFYFSVSTIRNYVSNDIPVLHKLLRLIKAMMQNDQKHQYTHMLLTALSNLVEQFTPDIISTSDKQRLTRQVAAIIAMVPGQPENQEVIHKLQQFCASDA